MSDRFIYGDAHPELYSFTTPEELCELLHRYRSVLWAFWQEVEGESGDEARVRISQPFDFGERGDASVETLQFNGLARFASHADAVGYCRHNGMNPARWGVVRGVAMNFKGSPGNSLWPWEKQELGSQQVDADELWSSISDRRIRLGAAAAENRPWWAFWR